MNQNVRIQIYEIVWTEYAGKQEPRGILMLVNHAETQSLGLVPWIVCEKSSSNFESTKF